MAGAQVEVAASCIDKQRLGYQAISLTNFVSDTLEPAIAAGSKVEIGGALFEFAGNEAITGLAGIVNSSDIYILLTVTGTAVAASGSITAPVWDTAKQGWYSGAVRVIGGLYKDGSGNYASKWLYEEKQVASVKRYGNGKVTLTGSLEVTGAISAGVGNAPLMFKSIPWSATTGQTSASVLHGLTSSKIRGIMYSSVLMAGVGGRYIITVVHSATYVTVYFNAGLGGNESGYVTIAYIA